MEQQESFDAVNELYSQIENLKNKNSELSQYVSASAYGGATKDANLIISQLDTQELLEKLEKFYRGDYLAVENENIVWKKQENEELRPLNEYGVNMFMEVVTKYIDKNTALSNYNEERIFEILADIGDELTLVVYCNYEKMGMDTYFKKTKFRLLVATTLHLIESTYRRSIEGSTSKDINQSRIVSQSDTLARIPGGSFQYTKKKPSFIERMWGT